MKSVALTLVSSIGVLVSSAVADSGSPAQRRLPKNTDVYLMENDLVYARFLALMRDGTYRQINRDERGSQQVDEGRWQQDEGGLLRLHSSCRALRSRALKCGPLSVIVAGQAQIEALPRLLAALQNFLAESADTVFDAGTATELQAPGAPKVDVEQGRATFDRTDAVNLAARLADAWESERSGTYVLAPVKNAGMPLFLLPESAFRETDLPAVRRLYRVDAAMPPPFYFARIDAAAYAREVGRWQPLHLPGSVE